MRNEREKESTRRKKRAKNKSKKELKYRHSSYIWSNRSERFFISIFFCLQSVSRTVYEHMPSIYAYLIQTRDNFAFETIDG